MLKNEKTCCMNCCLTHKIDFLIGFDPANNLSIIMKTLVKQSKPTTMTFAKVTQKAQRAKRVGGKVIEQLSDGRKIFTTGEIHDESVYKLIPRIIALKEESGNQIAVFNDSEGGSLRTALVMMLFHRPLKFEEHRNGF